MASANLAARLLAWYRANRRDLPWRGSSDPYAIWVSEVMLQQTQVASVIPYFERFLARFPSPAPLADADEQEALAAWQGLGYYRRVKNLRLAMAAVTRSGMPPTADELMRMPGVGRYTSRAIASMAFGEAVACVDGNVERVLSRVFVTNRNRAMFEALSETLMPPDSPGDWNQALMELGATVCLPKEPICGSCPIARDCAAFASGSQSEFPAVKARPKTVRQQHVCVVPFSAGSFGIRQIPEGEWWEGMWEFPRTVAIHGEGPDEALARLGFCGARALGTHSHTVTHHRLTLLAYLSRARKPGLRWVPAEGLAEIPMPAPQRVVANLASRALGL